MTDENKDICPETPETPDLPETPEAAPEEPKEVVSWYIPKEPQGREVVSYYVQRDPMPQNVWQQAAKKEKRRSRLWLWISLAVLAVTVAAVVLALLPPQLNTVIALYPVFFAMSFQWSSFAGARGFYSATIFSTNNTKQSSLALAEYLCDHDRAHLRKMWFYLATLGCFHVGASWAFCAVKWWFTRGSLAVLPLVAWGYFLAVCERRHEEAASIPEDAGADTAAQPSSNM